MMITTLIEKAVPRLKNMGRQEIAKDHAAGNYAVYSDRPGEIVREYPDGRKEVQDAI